METKDIILELRTKKGLSQEELAEKIILQAQQAQDGQIPIRRAARSEKFYATNRVAYVKNRFYADDA